MDILRFITAGSVDDGKSTLIGRLLYDSKSILVDELEALERASKGKKDGAIDLALLTDGLRAEREQGITIDVAYKYFATPKRKFIIADAPGHIQYTRNMITGASTAALIIILVDARNGVVEQTRRHSIIASLLHLPNVVVAINKMDLVGYSEEVYNDIVSDYKKVAANLSLNNVVYLPVSALNGDNIVDRSSNISWYDGPSLLDILETTETEHIDAESPRFTVQYVLRPQTEDLHDYRGYAGKIFSGTYKKGDAVSILPSGLTTHIKSIEVAGVEVEEAFAPQNVILHVADDIDISRGDVIVNTNELPSVSRDIDTLISWMDSKPLAVGNRYLIQSHGKLVAGIIKEIQYKVDVNTLEESAAEQAGLNEVARVKIKTNAPVVYDSFKKLRANGGFILIDETSNVTVGAGLFQ